MDVFLEDFKNILRRNNSNMFHVRKYVDDILLIGENMLLVSRWREGNIERKISTMTCECIRRLKNTSEEVGRTTWEGIKIELMDDLAAMGYD